MGVSIFLPTRRNSERVPDKNTRNFAGIEGGLLKLKLIELSKVKEAREIILSSNDQRSLKIGETFLGKIPHLRLVERPDSLGSSQTKLPDLIAHAGAVSQQDHILWTHVTSPFCDEILYKMAILTYLRKLEEGYDSLFSGTVFQNFLWDEETGGIINRKGKDPWPRTQDLKTLFEINNALFLGPRSLFAEEKERVGKKPFLFEMGKIPSLDIDDIEDFKLAEILYESTRR